MVRLQPYRGRARLLSGHRAAAMADYRRAVRVGRLLLQDRFTLIQDLVAWATIRLGVEAIYQKLALAENIDAAGNVFLGRELVTRIGTLDDSAMASETRNLMQRLNPRFLNLTTPVMSLSGGQRQSVAIGRAVYFMLKRQEAFDMDRFFTT